MRRLALAIAVGLGVPAFARAQDKDQEYPLHIKKSVDYGIPKDLLDVSELRHCHKLEGQWPVIRFQSSSIQKQKCFRDDAKKDRVTVVSLFNAKKKFVAVIAFVFERESAKPWLLVSEGVEERGEATKRWRVVPNVDLVAYLLPKADEVYGKLCAHYKLQCLLPDKK